MTHVGIVCSCVHVFVCAHGLLQIFSQMDCCTHTHTHTLRDTHTADLIYINELNLYNENLMLTIGDLVPGVHQGTQLVEQLVCMSV